MYQLVIEFNSVKVYSLPTRYSGFSSDQVRTMALDVTLLKNPIGQEVKRNEYLIYT